MDRTVAPPFARPNDPFSGNSAYGYAQILAQKALNGEELSREEALAVLAWPEDEILDLLQAAFKVRRAVFGKRVKLNFLVNIQSGICPEDCGYCSQSRLSDAPVDKYKLMTPEDVVAAAERAVANKASRLCMVASMRGPSDKDVNAVAQAVTEVRAKYPQLELCACLGLLKEGQAEKLEAAGVDAYNHNLNTSERHYGEVCTTHGFSDRLDTVRKSRSAGMSSCSGALFGMGESQEDILDVAYRLRELGVDSIPVNFLMPFKGTPFEDKQELTPLYCLKLLCLFRLLCPSAELRVAGGRELHLRSLQVMSLYPCTSLFVGDYLTSEGQAGHLDLEMIRDLGFEILGGTIRGETPSEGSPLKERIAITHSHRT
jgi:biotin synthase